MLLKYKRRVSCAVIMAMMVTAVASCLLPSREITVRSQEVTKEYVIMSTEDEVETKVFELTKEEAEELENEDLLIEENISLEGSTKSMKPNKKSKKEATNGIYNDFSVLGVDLETTEQM